MATFNRRFGRIFIPIWIACACLFTLAAAADSIWNIGWGYQWKDAAAGAGMIAFGVVFWFFWHFVLKIVIGINAWIFGPDPADHRGRQDDA
ncbi:hypothetical protein [Qipengyuania mesophila]|uniref:hypothetical protein n=1 Tax=Qipengyuania mesophila TaxID=2867246 RepID=UPI003511F446